VSERNKVSTNENKNKMGVERKSTRECEDTKNYRFENNNHKIR
jgi:hypothetical protein